VVVVVVVLGAVHRGVECCCETHQVLAG